MRYILIFLSTALLGFSHAQVFPFPPGAKPLYPNLDQAQALNKQAARVLNSQCSPYQTRAAVSPNIYSPSSNILEVKRSLQKATVDWATQFAAKNPGVTYQFDSESANTRWVFLRGKAVNEFFYSVLYQGNEFIYACQLK